MGIFISILAGALGGIVSYFIMDRIRYRKPVQEFVSFNNATRAGQHVMGNIPDRPDTFAPHINKGGKFFGTLKKFPADIDEDIYFMDKFF